MFRRLSTKLALLYASLFGAILLIVSLAVYTAISHNAERLVRDELQASGTVFDRIWAVRSQQLQDSAELLSRDFGFREAVATDEAATVSSALQNLQTRSGIDLAFLVGVDGRVTTADGRSLGAASAPILHALESQDAASGVFVLDGTPYQAVSAPVLSPVLAGWVVFAMRLDDREMTALEKLAAIPLEASVLAREGDGRWRSATTSLGGLEAEIVSRFVAEGLSSRSTAPRELAAADGPDIALVKPLRSLSEGQPAVLLLRYPLARAMAPFQPLVQTLVLTGAAGVLLIVIGSFMLAGQLTRPITALDQAAQRLKRGDHALVTVNSRDEIARLADSFNGMAAEIRDREAKMLRDAETLALALDRAQAANRTTNEFLANMSHEVRTPLNGVLGLSQVLARTLQDPAQRELVGAVIESAESLERLLSDVLDAARLSAGQTEVKAEPFGLASAVRTAGAAWERPAKDKGLAFVVDIAPEADLVVLGDPERLRQILDNLLSNAVKFTAAGEIGLVLCVQGTRYRFEVRDTGVGFDPAQKERLFQPFQQADGSSTRRYGGTGLGLSISRGLAELMGGTLDGAPRPDGGSSFVLELPLPAAGQGSQQDPPARVA